MNLMIYIFVAPLLLVISKFPFWLLYQLSNLLYVFVYHITGYRKKAVQKNIALCGIANSPAEQKQIERKFYRFLCDLLLEAIKVKGMSKKQMLKRFTVTNPELVENFAKQGKSVFVMTGHYANFEWLLALGYYVSLKPVAIYAPLQNKYFDSYFQKVRSKHNAALISRKKFTEEFAASKRKNELNLVGFAADQSPRNRSKNYYRTFFGHEVPVFTGAERLGKRFDVPIVMAKVKRVKRGYYETTFSVLAENPNEVADFQITDAFYKALEEQIKEDPSLYFWTHNRFKLMRQKKQ
ncbi:MAG: Lipid A biosynthesis lauroyltransferase [Bacteroidota bacterium]|nr:MAG: Lipid A biosynthesis lauroyltransferase [Bacteroidota bacterium]